MVRFLLEINNQSVFPSLFKSHIGSNDSSLIFDEERELINTSINDSSSKKCYIDDKKFKFVYNKSINEKEDFLLKDTLELHKSSENASPILTKHFNSPRDSIITDNHSSKIVKHIKDVCK